MLATFLRNMRSNTKMGSEAAASTLGASWKVQDNGALQRDFTFADFHEAKFFITRYSAYCQKINMNPEWSNVYNRVSVTLHSAEFQGITQKEVNAGKYLNMVSEVNIRGNAADDDIMTFDEIVAIGKIEEPAIINNQDEPTSLYVKDEVFSVRKTQVLIE